MTLRSRLVTGLVALMAVGLAIFGVTTYELYSRSQYRQLNSDLQSSVPLVTEELAQAADVTLPLSDGPGASQSRSGGPMKRGASTNRNPRPAAATGVARTRARRAAREGRYSSRRGPTESSSANRAAS